MGNDRSHDVTSVISILVAAGQRTWGFEIQKFLTDPSTIRLVPVKQLQRNADKAANRTTDFCGGVEQTIVFDYARYIVTFATL